MKHIGLGSIIIASAILTACNSETESTDNGQTVSNFEIRESIRSSSQCFRLTSGSDSCYLTLRATIQWPEKFADYDIRPLQDTILRRSFDSEHQKKDINKSITAFVNDWEMLDLYDDCKAEPVKGQIPETVYSYSSDIDVRVIEVTPKTVTYQMSFSSYLGGAHGMTVSTPFSYEYSTGTVLTSQYLFKPGTDEDLSIIIQENLADKLDVSISGLRNTMLVSEFPISDIVYIYQGMIVFHYNPYDILPYSMGEVDVTIPLYQIREMLTSEAESLLLQ